MGEVDLHECRSRTKRGRCSRAADEDAGAGVAEQEREPFLWIARVQRDVRAAGLQDPERSDHELSRALEAEPDAVAALDAERAQGPAEMLPVPVELPIGENSFWVTHRERSGPPRRRGLHEPLDTLRHRNSHPYSLH